MSSQDKIIVIKTVDYSFDLNDIGSKVVTERDIYLVDPNEPIGQVFEKVCLGGKFGTAIRQLSKKIEIVQETKVESYEKGTPLQGLGIDEFLRSKRDD